MTSKFNVLLLVTLFAAVLTGQCIKSNRASAESNTWAVNLNVTTDVPGYKECAAKTVDTYFREGGVSYADAPYDIAELFIDMIVGESPDKSAHIVSVVVSIKPLIQTVPPTVILAAFKNTPEGRANICKLPAAGLQAHIDQATKILRQQGKGI